MAEAADHSTNDDSKTPRFRSPPYPAISLDKAVERAAELYAKSLHHAVPIAVVASSWGYGEKSSGLFGHLAALKQFGLLSDEGSGPKRRFKLTDGAVRVVRDPDPHSEKRRTILATAALNPKVHAELWSRYGAAGASGSMDIVIKSYLTLDRADDGGAPFSDNAADDLISEYKQTIAYAGLMNGGLQVSPDVSSDDNDEEGKTNLPSAGKSEIMQTAQLDPVVVKAPPPPAGNLNDIRAEIAGGRVRIDALLDKDGLEKLEKKIAALKELLS